ncbi:uncharacterized protein LOC113388418 [Ctenocephalides felis]|uniref:uncharacterized protein LOC113388418 n=1 Tax=Ctenocephalides felis TaxID=7515 RepID=UPI000E6E433C|nr:uncharacterized protein LOC113388418 [Ctenocephalides felis]
MALELFLEELHMGISLRQITDGKNFIQMIHHRGQGLMDCDYSRRRKTIDAFLESFNRDIRRTYSVSHQKTYNHTRNHHQGQKTSGESVEGSPDDSPDGELSKARQDERSRIESFIENGVLAPEDLDFNWNQRRVGVHNATFVIIKSMQEVPGDMRGWLNYAKMKRQCERKHRELRRDFKRRERHAEKVRRLNDRKELHPRFRRGLTDFFIAPGTKWCGMGNRANRYTELGGFTSVDSCCRMHDSCTNIIRAVESKYDYFNFSPFTVSHCGCDRRKRRGLSSLLRVPGTEWCGLGYGVTKYTQLGGFSKADRCCRQHDMRCKHWIQGFSERYGYFNWGINTLMHCSCDQRFRTCLKIAGTTTAEIVGKLFFNVVQTKCFVFKTEKVCTKYTWWKNTCKKYTKKKRAVLRSNMAY